MLHVAPLFPVAAGLIAGIAADHAWSLYPGASAAAVLLFSFAAAVLLQWPWEPTSRFGRSRVGPDAATALLLGVSFSVGALQHWSTARCLPSASIGRVATDDGVFVRLRGRIITPPQVLDPRPNPFSRWIPQLERTAFVMDCEAVEGVKDFVAASGRVRVTIYEAALGLRLGERCEVFGRLQALLPPDNPGAFDWRMYSLAQGVAARLSCQHRENVRPMAEEGDMWFPGEPLAWLRSRAALLLTDDLPADAEEPGGLLESMLLGQRSQASEKLNDVFVRSGCVHYLSVSGVHLVIVMFLARGLCHCAGASRTRTTWLMMLAVVMYVLLAEPRPPILRAGIIGLVYCLARLIGRERAYLNWTSLAAILLLLVNPLWLFDVGFQLSFAAVLGVGYLSPVVKVAGKWCHDRVSSMIWRRRGEYAEQDRRMREHAAAMASLPPTRGTKFVRWCGRQALDGLSVSVAASLAGMPIVAIHFYRVQPWSPLASTLLMLPVTALMALGIVKMIAGAISPSFSALVGVVLQSGEAGLMSLVDWLASLPGANIAAPVFPWWVHFAFYACLTCWVLRVCGRARQDAGRDPLLARADCVGLPRFTSRIGFGALIVAVFAGAMPGAADRTMRITFLSVGRGLTTVIELPDGTSILYDAGASYSSDPGRNIIAPFLLSRGIHRIDRLYISHPNLDHFSGVPTLVSEIKTEAVVLNACFEGRAARSSPSAELLSMLQGAGCPIERLPMAPAKWQVGQVDFELLWPAACESRAPANDTSTVLRISWAGRSVLLTGDIDELAQESLLAGGDLRADILALPHHGSVRRTTRQFIEAVSADALVRSSDEPMSETINGLVQVVSGRTVYNTADVGAVTIEIDDAGGLSVVGMRREASP